MLPTVSFSSIGNLSDILKDLPLVSPTDFGIEDDHHPISLFDNNQQIEKSNQLINSNNPYLVDVLNRTLSQIDTSKISFKPSSESTTSNSDNRIYYSPILRNLVSVNPRIFNGVLNEQIANTQQIYNQNQQQAKQQQHPPQPTATYQNSQIQPQQQNNALPNKNDIQAQQSQPQTQKNFYNNESQKVHLKSDSNSNDISQQNNSSQPRHAENNGRPVASQQQYPNNYQQPVSDYKSNIKQIDNDKPKNIENQTVAINKFYSSTTSSSSKPAEKNTPQKPLNQEIKKQNENSDTKNSNKKKPDNNRPHNKNSSLGTWQANLQSQLLLPEDFTPELISQLASEGYDVISATGGRKARNRPNPTTNQPVNNNIIDDSSDDDDEYSVSKVDKVTSSLTKPKNNFSSSKNTSSMPITKIDRNIVLNSDDITDHPSFKRFNQLLDDIVDTYEQDLQKINTNKGRVGGTEDEIDEIPSEYLLTKQICADLVQEAFKLNTYSMMNMIRRENLLKLQNLLFFNIKDGLRSIQLMNEDNSSGNFDQQDKLFKEILIEKLLRASDCSIISLIIMTSNKISKELIIEDVIEQIATFTKVHLTETIFPHYDPVYKPVASSTDSSSTSQKPNSKRKLLNQFQNTTHHSSNNNSSNLKTKNMQHFYNRMREILNLLSELVCQIDLTDTIIITLTSLSIMCFFVENINDLQLESLKILTNIFTRYSKHRQLVFDDILSSLIKLHPNKRNARSYKCFNGDSIQMFSALLLQLIQCEVTNIDHFQQSVQNTEKENPDNQADVFSFEEKETYIINSYENSTQTAKKFLSVFFSKCKTKQADSDFRPIFENFIQDLLITVNKPEWPVSEIILNLLGIILVSQIQNEQNDVGSRVNSLEYLGQIVSQLRKDSLEYQKYPEKITQVLEKLKIKKTDNTELLNKTLTEDEIYNLQKSLINYLDSLVANDSSLQYSKFFLVGQWLKEANQTVDNNQEQDHGQDRIDKHAIIEEHRKRLYSLIEKVDKSKNKDSASGLSEEKPLDMTEAFILSKFLCSLKKSLDKNFDYYLVNILSLSGGASEANTPTQVRSKAIKCLSSIIEADPQILLKQKVFSCVRANFLHQTISVREASVDLIGRFITLKPELTNHYYELLSDRILDVGVSVRKRAIKIFRDVCLNQPDFEHLSEICVKILRRINDEDGIKKLVIDMFYSIWFAPINSNSSNTRQLLLKRVLNIVDVVSDFNTISNNVCTEIFEQLFNSLIQNPTQNGQNSGAVIKEETNTSSGTTNSNTTNTNSANELELQQIKSREVIKSCKQIVDCLIENVLNTEANTTTPHAYKRLVASFSTLFLLSKIKPENFINHAETLLPYLNIKSTNQNDNQIINSAARILECVVPLLQSPSNSFLISLEESLCKLIFQGGMMIVSSCISCLGTVVNKLTRNYKLAADCLNKFFNSSCYLKRTVSTNKTLEANTKPMVFRMLFTLGLLSKHFDVESPEFAEYKVCNKQELFDMFLFFMRTCDVDVQHKALIGLGSFLTRYSDYMITNEVKNLYLNYIKGVNVPVSLKSQVFVNLTDYLNEEDQRNLAKSVELSKNHCKDDLKEMLDVQSGMASTIIQSYLKSILESYLTPNTILRINIFNCLSMILNQGLVYPIECVPYLIAMTTDNEKKIQSNSLNHLTNLQKAHPGFVQSKSIAGVNVSFLLQKTVKRSQLLQESNGEKILDELLVVRGFSEQGEVLSMNHHLYSLLRTNRSYRRAFLQQLLKKFDDSSLHVHTSLAYMLYISDNLAYFPYQLLDEPLYLIHQIDLIISVTGINLLQTFKENLLNYKPREDSNKSSNMKLENKIQIEGNQLSDYYVNQDCQEEENIETKPSESILSRIEKNNKIIDDDDDETFESVYTNLPPNLKPLKDCMYKAQGCCLLLVLKQFLKEVYSISNSKIQNYSPTDTAKVNDRPITSRKTNRKFNPKQIIEYMLKSDNKNSNSNVEDEDEDEIKRSLINEYLEFKELMLTIDQEDNKMDENKPNSSNVKGNVNDVTKLTALQQRLFEGIEKTKPTGGGSSGYTGGQDSTTTTPRSKVKGSKSRNSSNSASKRSNKKRKRKKDSDGSSDDGSDFNSDLDD